MPRRRNTPRTQADAQAREWVALSATVAADLQSDFRSADEARDYWSDFREEALDRQTPPSATYLVVIREGMLRQVRPYTGEEWDRLQNRMYERNGDRFSWNDNGGFTITDMGGIRTLYIWGENREELDPMPAPRPRRRRGLTARVAGLPSAAEHSWMQDQPPIQVFPAFLPPLQPLTLTYNPSPEPSSTPSSPPPTFQELADAQAELNRRTNESLDALNVWYDRPGRIFEVAAPPEDDLAF